MKSKPKRTSVPAKPEPLRGSERNRAREEADVIMRLLASAMGLPRLCVYKACRRRKRCIGPDMVCAEHHHGLARKRMKAAIKLICVPAK